MKTDNFILNQDNDRTPWRLLTPKGSARDWCVIWLQGFTSTIEGHAEGLKRMAEQTNTPFAMLNYAGHGNHPTELDDATRAQQLREVIGVYDELHKLGFSKFIAIGGSFGAYMAALLSAERPLESLTLRVPAIYEDSEFDIPFKDTRSGRTKERSDVWRETVSSKMVNKALHAVGSFTGDTYVIEHELDSVINPAVPKAYFEVAKHPNYIVIRGCDHSPKLMPDPEKFFAIIEQWIATIVISTKLKN